MWREASSPIGDRTDLIPASAPCPGRCSLGNAVVLAQGEPFQGASDPLRFPPLPYASLRFPPLPSASLCFAPGCCAIAPGCSTIAAGCSAIATGCCAIATGCSPRSGRKPRRPAGARWLAPLLRSAAHLPRREVPGGAGVARDGGGDSTDGSRDANRKGSAAHIVSCLSEPARYCTPLRLRGDARVVGGTADGNTWADAHAVEHAEHGAKRTPAPEQVRFLPCPSRIACSALART